jgi:hypothetical protein
MKRSMPAKAKSLLIPVDFSSRTYDAVAYAQAVDPTGSVDFVCVWSPDAALRSHERRLLFAESSEGVALATLMGFVERHTRLQARARVELGDRVHGIARAARDGYRAIVLGMAESPRGDLAQRLAFATLCPVIIPLVARAPSAGLVHV